MSDHTGMPPTLDGPTASAADTPDPKPRAERAWITALVVLLGLMVVGGVVWTALAPPATTPPATPSPTPTVTVTQNAEPAPIPCLSNQLQISLGTAIDDGAAGTTIPLLFANASDTGCTLAGYPRVTLAAGGAGPAIGAEATPDPTTAASTVSLVPGAGAQAILTIADANDICQPIAAGGLLVVAPGTVDEVFVENTALLGCDGESLLTVSSVRME